MSERIVALDLASTTGWAMRERDGQISSGHLALAPDVTVGPSSSPEPYWDNLRRTLDLMAADVVVIERGFHRGAASTFLGGLIYTARMWAYDHHARFCLCPQATWRKSAREIAADAGITIAPRASKADYHSAARQLWGIRQGDEADARWLLEWYERTPAAVA